MSTRACNILFLGSMIFLSGCSNLSKLSENVEPIPPAFAQSVPPAPNTGGIWNPAHGNRLLLAEDRRARSIGDVLTIRLVERVQAEKSAGQSTSRKSNRELDLPDKKPLSWFPEELFSGGTSSSFRGEGSASQENRLSGEIAVFVTSVLPNGALMVAGDKRIMLSRGEEQIQFRGIVRPEDIGADNRVLSTRVADASIRYTGTGEIAAQARQGWLSRFFDKVSPF